MTLRGKHGIHIGDVAVVAYTVIGNGFSNFAYVYIVAYLTIMDCRVVYSAPYRNTVAHKQIPGVAQLDISREIHPWYSMTDWIRPLHLRCSN